tara:strand:+ start:763 stop:1404 length:642 start_codon:yes stop_codon:yes gene_type:complete
MTINTTLKVTALISLSLLVGCVGIITPDYEGGDAGYAVIGIGAAQGTMYTTYRFDFRKADGTGIDSFFYFQNNSVWGRGNDYENGKETGVIDARALPPGEYEIYSYEIFHINGMVHRTFSPKEEFSIPFSILPGETAYLGNYQANGLKAVNIFGMPLPGGAYFIHNDTVDRDIEIAKKLKPTFLVDKINKFLASKETLELPYFEVLDNAAKKH